MLWKSWQSIGTVLGAAVVAYIGLLVILRVSGKRTLSKLNAFDWIVSVALGSTLATTLVAPDVSVSEGLTALAALVGLQFIVTQVSVRVDAVRRAVKAVPKHVVLDGRLLPEVMKRERVTDDEVLQAVRSAGFASLERVDVVLETDGTLSVMRRENGANDALDNVE